MKTKIAIAQILILAVNLIPKEVAVSQNVRDKPNLASLCQKFPSNSRCQNGAGSFNTEDVKERSQILRVNREHLCNNFPQNSYCLKPPLEVMKIRLARSGNDDEWIRLERQENIIKVLHTTRVKDVVVSAVLNGALGLVPIPLPFIKADRHNWKDHQVTGVAFQPDRCKLERCLVKGINTLTLPAETSIHEGMLTVEYLEEGIARSLTFKVSTDVEIEVSEFINITVPDRH